MLSHCTIIQWCSCLNCNHVMIKKTSFWERDKEKHIFHSWQLNIYCKFGANLVHKHLFVKLSMNEYFLAVVYWLD
jgi:hypothetical protein